MQEVVEPRGEIAGGAGAVDPLVVLVDVPVHQPPRP
jgi:hypothetical protein